MTQHRNDNTTGLEQWVDRG